MVGEKLVVRQPPEFKLNKDDDFTTWYAQFVNFATAMSIAEKDHFVAISTYLDTAAFTTVENLKLTAEQKADPKIYKPFLEKALKSESEKIPPMLALRYKTQKSNETLSHFALELGKLANKSDIAANTREQLLIDSFCTGVKDTDLSIKLLEGTFTTLTLALDRALKIESANKIRNFVRPGAEDSAPDIEIMASENQPGPSEVHDLNQSHDYDSVNVTTPGTSAQPGYSQQGPNVTQQRDQQVRPQQFQNYNNRSGYNPTAQPFQPRGYNQPSSYNYRPRDSSSYRPNSYTQRGNQYNRDRAEYRPEMQRNNASRPPAGNGNSNMSNMRVCYYCGIPGHVIRQCRRRLREEAPNFQRGPSPRQ